MVVSAEETFWTDARRRLIAKTLANLFLLLLGAAATGDAIGVRWWIKLMVASLGVAVGIAAVLVLPALDDAREEGT